VDSRPIGIFDSGVGGLSILQEVRKLLPHENLVYLADGANFPYGELTPERLCQITTGITAFLCRRGVKLVVVACNSATVATLRHLRTTFPQMPFIGVVPVVKTLAAETRTGTIALLSTPATAHSAYLAGLIGEFASDKQVINVGCPELAQLVEQGDRESERTRMLLQHYLAPIRASSADVLGLACTHYPFLRFALQGLLGPGMRVFDSSEPVARRVQAVLAERDALGADQRPHSCFFSTGDQRRFAAIASRLLGITLDHVRIPHMQRGTDTLQQI